MVKPYTPSKYGERLTELIERLSSEHPQYSRLSKELGSIKAGDYGEEVVYKELTQIKLPYNHYIFHKVYLCGDRAFELDFIIITPYGVVILEVKNIIGELEFSTNPSQLIQRKEDGQLKKYPCPANQLNDYKYQLSQLFLESNISVPIQGVVVFASRNSFVKQSTKSVKVIYKNELNSYFRNLPQSSTTLSKNKMEKIKAILLKPTLPPLLPLIEHFNIPLNDLKLGVKCESCGFIGMDKIIRTWYCPRCKYTSAHAHEKAITTYFSLCKETITNKECREFLLLNNRYEAKRILASPLLQKYGNSSSTFYKPVSHLKECYT